MTEVVPGTLALRVGGKAGHSLVSGGGAFSCQRGRGILSSAVPEYLLSRQLRPLEGKTHVHRARYCSHFAAVGSLSMPSATLSLQNRGRWKPFYMSTGRAHKLPRLRLRECLALVSENAFASASRTASSSPPGMSCLRFTKCLAFASGNALPSLHEMPRLRLRECFRLQNCLVFTLRNARPAKANVLFPDEYCSAIS